MRILNQFQKAFKLDLDRMIVFDLLLGTHEIVEADACRTEFDPTYGEYEDRLRAILAESVPSELNIVLLPSYDCNMRCSYCFEIGMRRSGRALGVAEIPRIWRQIEELVERLKPKTIAFTMMGGEPLTESNRLWFRAFFRECRDLAIPRHTTCITNGLDTESLVDAVTEFDIDTIQVTLDGMERAHNRRRRPVASEVNSFEAVVNSLDLLAKSNRQVELRINVDFENIPGLLELNDYVLQKQWKESRKFSAYLYPVTYGGCGGERASEYDLLVAVLEELESARPMVFSLGFHGLDYVDGSLSGRMFVPRDCFCGASKNQFVFNPLGSISTCWWGNAEQVFIVGTQHGDGYRLDDSSLKRWRARNVNRLDGCVSCAYKYVCGGGCAYKAHMLKGSIQKGNCAEFSRLIQSYLDFLVKRGEL